MSGTLTGECGVWVPSPEVILANCYHPALNTGHRAFGQLPINAQVMLDKLERQSVKWDHKTYFKGGLANTRIAILNGYHKSDRLLECMMVPNMYNRFMPYARCALLMCPFCAYLKGQDLLKKYGLAWASGVWYRLVFSVRGFVCLTHCLGDDMVTVWEAMRACIKRWSPSLDGCVGWEELAINSFWPEVLCTPHINVLICNHDEPDLESLAQIIAEEWQARGLSVLPDPLFDPVKSEAHFQRSPEYVKPIDILTPYNSGFRAAKDSGNPEFFHQNVRWFFEGYADLTTEFRNCWNKQQRLNVVRPITRAGYFYHGDCHGSSKSPVGIKPNERRTRDHQKLIRARVQNAKEDEMAQGIDEENHADAPSQ